MKSSGLRDASIAELRAHARYAAATRMTDLVLCIGHPPKCVFCSRMGTSYPGYWDRRRELSTDLIVVTKRAESRLRDLLLESVALQLLTNAECDVLVVRPEEDFAASRVAVA